LARRRVQRGLVRVRAAREMGICPETLRAWEEGREPPDQLWSVVIGFLGYDPSPQPGSVGERIRYARRSTGLTIRELASAIDRHRETIASWERNRSVPDDTSLAALSRVLGSNYFKRIE